MESEDIRLLVAERGVAREGVEKKSMMTRQKPVNLAVTEGGGGENDADLKVYLRVLV